MNRIDRIRKIPQCKGCSRDCLNCHVKFEVNRYEELHKAMHPERRPKYND